MRNAAPSFRVVAPPDVDIGVIYTYERDLMPKLLSTLSASGDGLRMRLVLVDNVSAEGVSAWQGHFNETLVVHNFQRLLYAANLNRILEASAAPYVLLLNTDMHFDPEEQCVARMVRFMDRHPDCGVAGCRLYHADGQFARPARRFQTLSIVAARRLGLGRAMPNTLADYFYADRSIEGSWPCDWLSGCFLMVRREAVRDVGPFDEGFAKYFEDVDFCYRMARSGWQVMYHGGTYCYHLERRDSKRLWSLDAARHLRSYLRWHIKWGFRYQKHLPAQPRRRKAA